MLSATRDSFVSSFPTWKTFSSFPYLIVCTRASSIVLNRNGEGRHPFPTSDLSGIAFNFSLLSMFLAVKFPEMPFTRLMKFSSIPGSLNVFIIKSIGFC